MHDTVLSLKHANLKADVLRFCDNLMPVESIEGFRRILSSYSKTYVRIYRGEILDYDRRTNVIVEED